MNDHRSKHRRRQPSSGYWRLLDKNLFCGLVCAQTSLFCRISYSKNGVNKWCVSRSLIPPIQIPCKAARRGQYFVPKFSSLRSFWTPMAKMSCTIPHPIAIQIQDLVDSHFRSKKIRNIEDPSAGHTSSKYTLENTRRKNSLRKVRFAIKIWTVIAFRKYMTSRGEVNGCSVTVQRHQHSGNLKVWRTDQPSNQGIKCERCYANKKRVWYCEGSFALLRCFWWAINLAT